MSGREPSLENETAAEKSQDASKVATTGAKLFLENSQASSGANFVLDGGYSRCSDRHCLPLLSAFDEIVTKTNIPHYILQHKAALRFPEMLMLLLLQGEREAILNGRSLEKACIAWTSDGMAFAIRNKEELINGLLPVIHFSKCKFSSFSRKLYRWGFRQVKEVTSMPGSGQQSELVFFHPLFQRDNRQLAAGMKSITAEGSRRGELVLQNVARSKNARSLKNRGSPGLTPVPGRGGLLGIAPAILSRPMAEVDMRTRSQSVTARPGSLQAPSEPFAFTADPNLDIASFALTATILTRPTGAPLSYRYNNLSSVIRNLSLPPLTIASHLFPLRRAHIPSNEDIRQHLALHFRLDTPEQPSFPWQI